jgi:multidrug efflux pump subunit AcrB
MKFVEYFIKNRVVTLVLTVLLVGMGVSSYNSMSRLEDPEFTIKDALVVTPYPGASALEVEQEVTDEIEQAVQQLGQIDEVKSRSVRGLSTVTVTIQDSYDKTTLPQVWDELRRKVGDAQSNLPPGTQPSMVIDDYGDVYGVFVVLYGEEYTYAELKSVMDKVRRELLLVEDVAKVEVLGESPEAVYIELNRERLSQMRIPAEAVINELQQRNIVTDSGRVQVGNEFVAFNPTGGVTSLEDFDNIRLSVGDQQIRLTDIATIRRGYQEPPPEIVRFNSHPGIAMGISTRPGGNVVTMGAALQERAKELEAFVPLGMQVGVVSVQSEAVTAAINSFIVSLIQAVVIVVVVLLLFMGLRSGLLIGGILIITILGTFIFLHPMGVALERISLGALIIALGMLVDNAIVIVDGMLVRINQGQDSKEAALEVVSKTAIPLLGATAIAIMAFAAIGTSEDSSGEFCRSLYQVILVSLSLSWVTAVTITPLLGVMMIKRPEPRPDDAPPADPYDTRFYRAYRGFLSLCLRRRGIVLLLVVGIFAVSMWGFGFVKSAFFPPSTRPQIMIDMWMPQGTHIDETAEAATRMEDLLLKDEVAGNVTTLVGKGALRFLLTYGPEKVNSAYAHFLVDVDDPERTDELIARIDVEYADAFPEAQVYAYRFELGPGAKGKIEPRFVGEDPDVLRHLGAQARAVIEAQPNAKAIVTEWRQRVKVVRPRVLEEQASLLGIDRSDVASTLRQGFQGLTVGVYREGDLLLPIILKAPLEESGDIASLANLQIWSPVAERNVSLAQLVDTTHTEFEDEIIMRQDRRRTFSIMADPITGTAAELLDQIREPIEAIELPRGYRFEWGGEYEDSNEAQESLASKIPPFIGGMILITILLFNSLRQPLVIWLCVPLILIGVTVGLLLFDQPFNFMAILGFLSLVGMMIKNAIVLVDEINAQQKDGAAPLQAILTSGTSRLRPVSMAAATTALGMVPLFGDDFFVAMAITIIFGLVVGSVLTMVILPVIYSVIFRVRVKE